jgi:hypothetical protein
MIETQHTSESLAASDGSRFSADPGGTLQQPVADSLICARDGSVRIVQKFRRRHFTSREPRAPVRRRERLGGMLSYYYREAA